MSSKKVSDLYCYRHDSESCGCREQLSFAAVPLPTSKPVVAKDVPPAWFKETRAAIRAFGGMLFACPCVPPNTAVQVRIDQMILDAVQCDVFAFMRVEHDTGDEDLRPIDEDAECPMCNRPLREYSGRHKDPRYHGRNVCVPLSSESYEINERKYLRVHNHWKCVHQAEVFSTAQTCRARRRLFSAT